MVKEVGNKFGLDKYTPHIFSTRSGKYYVPNQKLRGEILKLRHNPEVSAMMAGEFTKQNSQFMQERLGRKPSQGELYVAHFLGAKGAADLVSLANTKPDTRADRHFPKAARANKAIFYSRGRPRSVAAGLQRAGPRPCQAAGHGGRCPNSCHRRAANAQTGQGRQYAGCETGCSATIDTGGGGVAADPGTAPGARAKCGAETGVRPACGGAGIHRAGRRGER